MPLTADAPPPLDEHGSTPNVDQLPSRLRLLDQWARAHPWNPRIGPWFAYMVFLMAIVLLRDRWPLSYPLLKVAQIAAVCYLIWRWRKLTPELTWRFHWLAVPVGVGVFVVWIGLGWLSAGQFVERSHWLTGGRSAEISTDVKSFWTRDHGGEIFRWSALVTHFIAATLAVPMIEEVFNRSLVLRTFQRARRSMMGLLQVLVDFPLIDEWLMHTKLGEHASKQPPVFAREFDQSELGALSLFGVTVSTVVFMSVHRPVDWAGCVVCSVAYCLLLAGTRHKGLGPVIWAHAITNALLWGYVVIFKDWQFL